MNGGMMAYLVGVEPDPTAIRCGMPVEVTFIEAANGFMVPAFRPAWSSERDPGIERAFPGDRRSVPV
jgi:hypothetical protein